MAKFSISLAMIFLLFDCTIQHQFMVSSQEKSALIHLKSSLDVSHDVWPTRSDPCTSWKGIKCSNGRATGIDLSGLNRTTQPKFSVDALQNLTMLSSLVAFNFPLPGPIPDWFGFRLPSLQILNLSSCSINGTLPSTLFQSPNLTLIDLSRNNLTGPIHIPVSDTAAQLVYLDISANSLTGPIPPEIGTLSSLQYLYLSGNALSSSIPAEFSKLSRLASLSLGSNTLSGQPPDKLWFIPSLDISSNNLTGMLPEYAFTMLCNISHNSFYGNITKRIMSRFRIADLSWNYLEGPVPENAEGHGKLTWLDNNCLQDATWQRNKTQCDTFYAQCTSDSDQDVDEGVYDLVIILLFALILILPLCAGHIKKCYESMRTLMFE